MRTRNMVISLSHLEKYKIIQKKVQCQYMLSTVGTSFKTCILNVSFKSVGFPRTKYRFSKKYLHTWHNKYALLEYCKYVYIILHSIGMLPFVNSSLDQD